MKFAVIVFPGSNCDEDAYHAASSVLGEEAEYIWHKATALNGADVVILPGLPGLSREINVHVPSLTLKNVGRSGNGAAIHDVAMQVITALAERAAQSGGIPAELKGLLHLNVAATAASVGNEAVKRVGEAVPGQLGKDLLNNFGNPGGSQPSGRTPSSSPRR